MSVYMSVCLSVFPQAYLNNTCPYFTYMLPLVMHLSFCDVSAIYLLCTSVLCITGGLVTPRGAECARPPRALFIYLFIYLLSTRTHQYKKKKKKKKKLRSC